MYRDRKGFDSLIKDVGQCELCGSRRNLQVHHIVPLVIDIPGVDLNDESNLVVVCSKCHGVLTPKNILTRIGLHKAKANGKQIGQIPGTKLTTQKSRDAKRFILIRNKDFGGDLNDAECISSFGMARNSFYKYKRELRCEIGKE